MFSSFRTKGILLLLIVCLASTLLPPAKADAVSYRELAEYWAPDFYQDINYSYDWKADLISKFNYDGDWKADNNWDNLHSYPLKSYIYYSVVATSSHYFIGYYAFHPRDDGPVSADRHANDMEGVLLVIRKDGSTYGKFQLMETFAHYLFYQYTNDTSIKKGKADVDGGVKFRNNRPLVYIQPNGTTFTSSTGSGGGHGMYAYKSQSVKSAGIVYYYGGTASTVTTKPTGSWTQRYSYDLVSLDELFSRRENKETYPSFNKAPWGWDMGYNNNTYSDGETHRGDFLADPAHMVDTHLNGLGTFSHTYSYNPYATHIVTVQNVTSLHDADTTSASDIYVKITAGSDYYSGHKLWKFNDAAKNSKKTVYWGKNNAGDGNQYSASYNKRYLVKPRGTTIKIEVLDYDSASSSDSLGYKSAAPLPGNTVTWTDATTSNGRAKLTASIKAVQ